MADRPPRTALYHLDEIENGGAERSEASIAGRRGPLIAVRVGGRADVYVNSCPHIGAPPDFPPGRFLNAERTRILCTNHRVLFRIEDGT